MYKKKIKKKISFFAIILIIIASTSSIFYFLNVEKEKNYIAIVEIKLGKTIDHIFLDSNADKLILEYATRSLENYLPQYKWELSITNQIEAKLYTKSKKVFYKSELPNLRKKIKKEIVSINKGIQDSFADFYKDNVTNDLLRENESGNSVFYWRLSTKPFYTGDIKTKVRFRKNQLTDFEFVSITIFITLSLIVFLISYFYINRKRIK